ncbi:MAG: hypothetical protein OXH90_03790 [Paracoccaceae bacterium]|nr:hypothetical protein [Paracoccaceae bacterium]MDE2916953.1 hypothetical protein [Paracoccaceae bacterium]
MQENFDEELKRIVQTLLKPARIVDLKSEEAEDDYGDPILNIRIVFEADKNRLDPEKVLSLARHLRQPLSEFWSDIDPVFSYMTTEEAASATT